MGDEQQTLLGVAEIRPKTAKRAALMAAGILAALIATSTLVGTSMAGIGLDKILGNFENKAALAPLRKTSTQTWNAPVEISGGVGSGIGNKVHVGHLTQNQGENSGNQGTIINGGHQGTMINGGHDNGGNTNVVGGSHNTGQNTAESQNHDSHTHGGQPAQTVDDCKTGTPALQGPCKTLILIFRHYGGVADRGKAAEQELSYAKRTSQILGCSIRVRSDALGEKDMKARSVKLWLESQAWWLHSASFVMVFAAGHGTLGTLHGSDGEPISEVNDIEKVVSDAVGTKPKLYFHQHCRGGNDPSQFALDSQTPKMPSHELDNSFRYYSTTQEFNACRTVDDSPFFRAVKDGFEAQPTCIKDLERKVSSNFKHTCHQEPEFSKSMGSSTSLKFSYP